VAGLARSLAAVVFITQFAWMTVLERGRADPLSILASVALWTAMLAVGRRWAPRVVVAMAAAVIVTANVLTYRFYHVPLDLQVEEAIRHSWRDVRIVLVKQLPWILLATTAAALVEVALITVASRVTWRAAPAAALVCACALVLVDPRSGTPDLRAVHGVVSLRRAPPRAVAGAVSVPRLDGTRKRAPNILIVLSESLRADDYLVRGAEATAPVTAAFEGRIDLERMRAVSSYTAVSLSALLTGRSQEGSREELLRAANVFDFAHAAGALVSYHSAHSRETFETKDVLGAVDRFFTLEDIAGGEVEDDAKLVEMPLDAIVVDRFIADQAAFKGPQLSMLHLYGTHVPYYFDDATARVRPFGRSVAWSQMRELRNGYRNAIIEQDRHVARAIRAFADHAARQGRPWIVMFTSDHGEAFGEHGAIHHGQSLYDEQVHVPAWWIVGPDAITDDERRSLADHAGRATTHLDLLPTLLDVLGIWDNFSVKTWAASMRGRSLLRAPVPAGVIPMTNCTGMFACPLNTWGLLSDDRKLIAQVWDGDWQCLRIDGPSEGAAPPGDASCASLRAHSRQAFPLLPNGTRNR
jgi:glucan phosphoethanolaminetransferase (alkaline phosphatase superfamily)